MKRLICSAGVIAMLFVGGACTEEELAELDSASACLDAASAQIDVIEAKRLNHSGLAELQAKARELQAECDAAERSELDLKTGKN